MAEATKYAPINGGTLITDFKSHFSLNKTKRTLTCAYGFIFIFIAFTIFLAFSPSTNSSSPWFTNIFTTSFISNNNSSNSYNDNESYGSHFSSIVSYFFPNSSSQVNNSTEFNHKVGALNINETVNKPPLSKPSSEINKGSPNLKNQSTLGVVSKSPVTANRPDETVNKPPLSEPSSEINKGSPFLQNQSTVGVVSKSPVTANRPDETVNKPPLSEPSSEINKGSPNLKNQSADGVVSKSPVTLANRPVNSTIVPVPGDENIAEKGVMKNEKNGVVDDDLVNCDLYDGNWVKDESYHPLYKPGSCSLIDEQFNCFLNGRPDNDYYKLKWKPKGCTLPRLNGTHMLELLRGKRLVFVGDSLNRNMWESLVCILRNAVKDQSKVYEESGRHHFRSEPSYTFIFEEYNCRVEFFVSPFLVQPWEVSEKDGTKKETLRLDIIGSSADKYKTADILIFNTGHWWTHEKTSKGKDYYQEGSHVYNELNVLEAFRKAITTWGRWVDANVNPSKTHVMFRGYSASHFSGGQWNSGGACDHETEPIKNDTYLTPYPPKMTVLEKVFKGMKSHVSYLNITRMTDYRKDGHPSIYRKLNYTEEERKSPLIFQDCSHWCLPGVPDAWNELLYAEMLVKQIKKNKPWG